VHSRNYARTLNEACMPRAGTGGPSNLSSATPVTRSTSRSPLTMAIQLRRSWYPVPIGRPPREERQQPARELPRISDPVPDRRLDAVPLIGDGPGDLDERLEQQRRAHSGCDQDAQSL